MILDSTTNLRALYEYFNWQFTEQHLFWFDGVTLKQLFHSYNCWGFKERTIEVPIIRHYLDVKKPGKQVLEIGNVTKHYYDLFRDQERDVVDRDEKAYDVINMDIKDFNPGYKYDFIFSISTFEHMPDKERLENMRHVYQDLLKPGKTFVLTFPINDEPDKGVSMRAFGEILETFRGHYRVFYYKAINQERLDNSWMPVNIPYNGYIVILEVTK